MTPKDMTDIKGWAEIAAIIFTEMES